MMVALMDFLSVAPSSGAVLSPHIASPWSPAFPTFVPSVVTSVPTFVSAFKSCSDPSGLCWSHEPKNTIEENLESKRSHDHDRRKHRQFSKHHKRKRKHKHIKNEPHSKYSSRASDPALMSHEGVTSGLQNGFYSSDPSSEMKGAQYYPFFAVLLPSIEPGREKIALEGIAMKTLPRSILKEQFREPKNQYYWPQNELQKLTGDHNPYYQSWNVSSVPAKKISSIEGNRDPTSYAGTYTTEGSRSNSLAETNEYEMNMNLNTSLAPKIHIEVMDVFVKNSTDNEKRTEPSKFQGNNFTNSNEENIASSLFDQYFRPSLVTQRRHRNVPVSGKEEKPLYRMLPAAVKPLDTRWTPSGSGQQPDTPRKFSGPDGHRRFFQTYGLDEPQLFSIEVKNEAHSTQETVVSHLDERRTDKKVPSVINVRNYYENSIPKNGSDYSPFFYTNLYSSYRQPANDNTQPINTKGRKQNEEEDGRRKSGDRNWPYGNKGGRHPYNNIPTLYDKEEEEEELMRKITKEEQITLPQKTQINDLLLPPRKAGKNRPQGGRFPGGQGEDDDEEEGRKQWDRLGQLIIVVTLAALGTVGNIFAIAAIISETSLRKAGNILLANTMIACLLVTAGVLPAGVVDLLAGWTHPSPVCKPVWVLTILAAYTVLITLPCMAWENHARQHSARPLPGCVLVAMIIASWCAAFSLTAAQWAGGYGPTHCEVGLISHDSLTACVGVPLVVTPILIMIILHSHTLLHTPKAPVSRPSLDADRSSLSEANTSSKKTEPQKDLALVATNLAVGLITGGMWAGGVAIDWWGSPEGRLNWLPSIAASSCGFLYAAHRPFRDAYYQLFNYCCCKTTVSMARRGRGDTPMELYAGYNTSTSRTTTEHVRVHIIPPYNMYSQASPRPTQHSSSKPSRSKERRHHKPFGKKEIYEL